MTLTAIYKFKKINLYVKTITALKVVQVIYRLWYMIRSKFGLINVSLTADNNKPDRQSGKFKKSFLCCKQLDRLDIEKHTFCFLNEKMCFYDAVDWDISEKGRLWCYNLHYFQYLLTDDNVDSRFAVDLIKDWINHNPVGTPDAWDPFPISLRLVNWIKFLHINTVSDEDRNFIVDSMVLQVRWLLKHLEYHLLGNHLFKNGKALMFMGLFLKGAEAEKWLKKGLKIVSKEIDEQVLDDGGHFERSPMYHSMILEDCLDLLNMILPDKKSLLEDFTGKLEEKTGKMAKFLMSMCHPDGQISLFNDAAFGIEAEPCELVNYYERMTGKKFEKSEDKILIHKDTGYYILAPDSETKMIIDCGHVGPDYQPGHSHCDTLSFELSVKGRRVIVDSGCYQYEDGKIRQYNRGNIGHNTITIDDENQSEVWGAHRCAKKAKPLDIECRSKKNGVLFFKGGHDGYKRLGGKPIHYREVVFQDQVWEIKDRIEGRGKHTIESRLHFHPGVALEFKDNEVLASNKGERFLKICLMGNYAIAVEKGWYCPEFGKKYACDVLVYKIDKIKLPFECGWKMEMEMER